MVIPSSQKSWIGASHSPQHPSSFRCSGAIRQSLSNYGHYQRMLLLSQRSPFVHPILLSLRRLKLQQTATVNPRHILGRSRTARWQNGSCSMGWAFFCTPLRARTNFNTDTSHLCKYRTPQSLPWADQSLGTSISATMGLKLISSDQLSGPNLGRNTSCPCREEPFLSCA